MTALMPLATDETPPPLLTVSGLEVSFGAVRALSGIDLAVQPGELIVLAGENGAGQNVLYAVAAAVIGGVSLFGGRGRMLGAVLGGLIVAVIYNGLSLLSLGAAAQDIWTALVLLAAVTVDTLARRGQTTP